MTKSNGPEAETNHPLTIEQMRLAKQDLADMQVRAEELWRLMTAAYGETDLRAVRAGDLHGAVKRLCWVLERNQETPGADSV
jgi:hypothetical protein